MVLTSLGSEHPEQEVLVLLTSLGSEHPEQEVLVVLASLGSEQLEHLAASPSLVPGPAVNDWRRVPRTPAPPALLVP